MHPRRMNFIIHHSFSLTIGRYPIITLIAWKIEFLLRDPQESIWTRPPDDCRGVALGDPPCHQQNTFHFVCSFCGGGRSYLTSLDCHLNNNKQFCKAWTSSVCCVYTKGQTNIQYNHCYYTIGNKERNHSPPPQFPPNMDISVVVDDAAIVVLTTVMTTHQTGTRFGCFRWFPNNFVFFSLE